MLGTHDIIMINTCRNKCYLKPNNSPTYRKNSGSNDKHEKMNGQNKQVFINTEDVLYLNYCDITKFET